MIVAILGLAIVVNSVAIYSLRRRLDRLTATLPATAVRAVNEAKMRFMFREGL
ncbi:hypothetical protein BH10PSE14_BH10PSE14_04590 [soil metagenome]